MSLIHEWDVQLVIEHDVGLLFLSYCSFTAYKSDMTLYSDRVGGIRDMDCIESDKHKEERCIQAVKYNKRNPKQFLLHVDSFEEPIIVHEDIFIKFRLMSGQCLSIELFDEIIEENNKYLAYISAIRYLGAKMRSSKQISEYLKRKEYSNEHISQAVQRLTEEKLIDDELYATMFVQSKAKTQGKGKLRIAQELQQQGISSQLVENALHYLDEEAEYDAAYRAAEKKLRTLKGEKRDIQRKLQQFLFRRGYSHSMIRKVMQSLENESKSNIAMDIYGELLDN